MHKNNSKANTKTHDDIANTEGKHMAGQSVMLEGRTKGGSINSTSHWRRKPSK